MIAVDTNVLVRYLTNDDPEEARKAMPVLRTADSILVTHTVLLELERMLRSAYELHRSRIQAAIRQILGLAKTYMDKADQLAKVQSWHEQRMDFADTLHLALALGADRCGSQTYRIAGYAHIVSRATVMQQQTGQSVRFELTEQTCKALRACIAMKKLTAGDYWLPSRHQIHILHWLGYSWSAP